MIILGQVQDFMTIIAIFIAFHMHVLCQVLCLYELGYPHISPLITISQMRKLRPRGVSNLYQAKLEFNAGQ